ncbi:helix-turn-helix transcriptional regulator [Leifsonia sp. NCR5]|uniref:helix-turn-helix transcriptional regulator n=1 Tax=Leifsonia sp. NCR5 TaxID=1978342 RepID=UPI000A197BC5|nr:helix-turn-helix transcriptional regulator [Leifsonia sp. NCR5]
MRSPASSASLIGREPDLEALRDELAAVADGQPRAVVIGGEAGIGKSRLVSEFLSEAASGATVLAGRSVDLGSDGAPYAPFTAILRQLVDAIGLDAVLSAAGPGSGVLSVLLPELASADSVPARTGAERLYELVTVLFENVSAAHPLVVAIEDIHWADTATLELVRFVIRMMERGRFLLLLTYRSDEVLRGHPLRSYLPELDRTRRATRWELARLSRAQVTAQAEQILGCPADSATIDRVYQLSEGVPFFVEELIGIEHLGTGEDLPETLRDLLLARYERLSEPAQGLLRLLSAAGVCVEHDLLAAVFDGTADQLDAAAREAVVAHVLAADTTEYSFRHALVREAIHADLLPGERTRFHTRYALAIEEAGGSASQISYHWMAAHDLRRAFIATLEAMEESRLSYAYRAAAAAGDRALELWDRVDDAEALAGRSRTELLSRTASALRNAGDSERALALVNVALSDTDGLSPDRHARLLRDKAQYLANLSRPGSVELLQEALAIAPHDPGDGLRAQLLAEVAGRLMLEARYDEAIQTSTLSIAEAADDASARRSVAHTIRGTVLVNHGSIDDGLADLDAARVLADGESGPLLRNAVNASDVMNLLGRFDEAVRIAQAGVAQARLRGVERTSGVMLASNTVEPLLALGKLDLAENMLDPALELDPPPGFRVHLQRMKLWLTLWRGDTQRAEDLLRRWRKGMLVQAEIEMQSRLGFARVAAEIAIARGDATTAWRDASVIISDVRRSIPAYDLPLLAVAARALSELAAGGATVVSAAPVADAAGGVVGTDVATSDLPTEHAAHALLSVLADLASWPTHPVWAPLVEAELAAVRSVPSVEHVEAWDRAAAAALADGAPAHLRPYALLRRAQAHAISGDRAATEQSAAEARQLAADLGFGLLVDAADQLIASAAPARHVTARGAEPVLTDREVQVLALIEQGLSNKQIGERLYISAKTASVHVSSILRKVGASSRTEAVYRAARVGAHGG